MSIGISVYPSCSTFKDDKKYIDYAHELGFTRVFTSLLELTEDDDEVVENFKNVVKYASNKGMEVVVDINPKIFKFIGVSFDDLTFFNEIGTYAIRLDMGFTGMEEATMTHNPFGIKIEVNMSIGTGYIDNIMSFNPNTNNLIGSHNFYPLRYTGLAEDFYKYCCNQFRRHNLKTAAFVTSQCGEIGPWPLQDGLCTLEIHRDLDIETQAQYYLLDNDIDCILIGNAYASNKELKKMSEVYKSRFITLNIEYEDSANEIYKKIVEEEIHGYRGDRNDYLIRSSMPRFKYKESDIPANNCKKIMPGDVVIGNNDCMQYKGELHIALKEMENIGRFNVIGRLSSGSIELLPRIKPWAKYRFISKEERNNG